MPKRRGLVWGIATPTETPLQSAGQIVSSVDKPLPGLPIQPSPVPVKRISVPKEAMGVLPRAKSELHLERTMRANSHQSLPELSTIIEEDRSSITSSRSAPVQTASRCQQVALPLFDQETIQADPLALMPILVPTQAPLRGWSPEDLDFPEMTSSNSSLASSRTTSVVTTPLPKWETESAYPFPLVRIANNDDGHAVMADEKSAFKTLSKTSAKLRSGANKMEALQHHPAIEEMFIQLDDAQSQWFDHERRSSNYSTVASQDGRNPARIVSEKIKKPQSTSVVPKDAKPKSYVSERARAPSETSNQKSKRSSGVRVPVPKVSTVQSVAPSGTITTMAVPSYSASQPIIEKGAPICKQKEVDATGLFTYANPEGLDAKYEKGRMEAERIAKDFWSKHKATKSGVVEKPPVKVMLESLFYTAPADLRPCPERLRFLGIRR